MSDVIITEDNKSAVKADVVEVVAESAAKDAEEAVVVKDEATVDKELPAKKNLRKEILVFVLSFFVPVGMFAAIWASQGITWNGEVTPLIYDLRAQYVPFMASLRYILRGEASLFYNWSLSMGGNYLSLFAYYLACPLNLITVFFPLDEMSNAVYLLTLIKMGLCGVSFHAYLRFGISRKEVSWANVVFATCYAMMSYNIMYNMCLMWMDGIIMMPIILLGIEKIFEGKRGLLYCLSMGSLFFMNFYISYMVGIFAAFYFLTGVFVRADKTNIKVMVRNAFRFFMGTVIGGLISATMLIPALLGYAAVNHDSAESAVAGGMYDFTVAQLLQKLLPDQYDSLRYSGLPSVYCGSILLVLAIIFLGQKRSWKNKVRYLFLLLLPISGFLVPKIDYVLHGFRIPHGFVYRYAFIFSFVIIVMAYEAYIAVKDYNKYMPLIFGICFTYLSLEVFMNGSVLIAGMNEEAVYDVRDAVKKPLEIYDHFQEILKEDEGFYRIGETWFRVTWNNPLMYNLVGLDSFSSTYNDAVTDFLIGVGGDDMASFSSVSEGLSPFMDTLLGIKYRLATTVLNDATYEKVNTYDVNPYRGMLYYNSNALSVGYGIYKGKMRSQDRTDVFYNQNQFVQELTNEELYVYSMVPLEVVGEVSLNNIACQFRTGKNDELELYLAAFLDLEKRDELLTPETKGASCLDIYVDDELVESVVLGNSVIYNLQRSHYTLGNYYSDGEHLVRIEAPEYCYISAVNMYTHNAEVEKQVIDRLSQNQLMVTSHGSDWLKGSIVLEEGQRLFTTIPYIDGMEIWSDGEKQVIDKDIEPFMCADLGPGEHEVEICYNMPGKWAGCVAGVTGLAMLILYYSVIPRFIKKRAKGEIA